MSAASRPNSKGKTVGHRTTTAYDPLSGTFHTIELRSTTVSSAPQRSRGFRNVDETEGCADSLSGAQEVDYSSVSHNYSSSGESKGHKNKERSRRKNRRKNQRRKEKRAHKLHDQCCGILMSRKLETLAQELVDAGFSHGRATRALISNEGKLEESVAWLVEGGEDREKHKDQDRGHSDLKIDISEELELIAEMETRFNCSKRQVEQAVVACEGDLEKVADNLKGHKQEPPSAAHTPEEILDSPRTDNEELLVGANQNLDRLQSMTPPSSMPQQSLNTVHSESDGANPQESAVLADNMWATAGSVSSVSTPLASPLQEIPPIAKSEPITVVDEGEIRKRQQKQIGHHDSMLQQFEPSRRTTFPSSLNSDQLYHQQQLHIPITTSGNFVGTSSRLSSITCASAPLSSPSSPIPFFGLSSGLYEASSRVDWNSGSFLPHLLHNRAHYLSSDRAYHSEAPRKFTHGSAPFMVGGTMAEPRTDGLGLRAVRRAPSSGYIGAPITGSHRGRVCSSETSVDGSQEWTSAFTEKDPFNLHSFFAHRRP